MRSRPFFSWLCMCIPFRIPYHTHSYSSSYCLGTLYIVHTYSQSYVPQTVPRTTHPKREWKVGTFCSGTDCAVGVYSTFLQSASVSLNLEPHELPILEHTFSCEKDLNKQTFIKEFCPGMKQLYTDALDPIPDVADIVSAGFPCDDASALHPRSASGKHRLCVSEARQ